MIAGAELMKIFATAKVFRGKWALLPTLVKRCFKFSIAICMNCVGKMLIWGHFWGVMELLLKNYLGHFLTIEKTFDFLFLESAIKPTSFNIQMPCRTECNRSNWWQPECFYEPASPFTTLESGKPKLPICDIHRSHWWTRVR